MGELTLMDLGVWLRQKKLKLEVAHYGGFWKVFLSSEDSMHPVRMWVSHSARSILVAVKGAMRKWEEGV